MDKQAILALAAKWRADDKQARTVGNKRIYVEDCARDLEALAATMAETEPVALPAVFAEKLADGWRFAYEPEAHYVGLNHPHGGKMSVVRVEFGNYAHEIGEAIAALFNSAGSRDAAPVVGEE